MVISIAIPSAMLKINTVEGFSATPFHPITPAVIIKGIVFGIKEHNKIFIERNKYNMQIAISTKAHIILDRKPLMIKRLCSIKVTLPPVSSTLYFVESNN